MSVIVLQDVREYIFPIFLVKADSDKNSADLDDRQFVGTGFFVTKRGDAIASAHTIPSPDRIPKGRALIAIVVENGTEKGYWITHAACYDQFDFALLKLSVGTSKYFELSFDNVDNGSDIQVIGIPDHEVEGSGKELRVLKGHVTRAGKRLELNFAIPLGMSGAPMFLGTKVMGFASGTARTEQLEDEIVEETTHRPSGEKVIRRTEVKRVIHYGIVCPLSLLREHRDPVLENRTIAEFIEVQNREP